jgi:hypothetical protein
MVKRGIEDKKIEEFDDENKIKGENQKLPEPP